MADPVSTAASVIGVVAVALQAVKLVHDAVERYKGRDKAMAQLSAELGELLAMLAAAHDTAALDPAGLALVRGPIEHCTKICTEFRDTLDDFYKKGSPSSSSMSRRDWARMEFKKGTLNEFTDTLASYKSTLQIGLGTIVMRKTTQTHAVLEKYNELVQDTAYNLETQLQRIQDKMDALETVTSPDPTVTVDLTDEKAVTEQCLRICEEAQAVLQRLQAEQPGNRPAAGETHQSPLPASGSTERGAGGDDGGGRFQEQFQAQVMTATALAESQLRLADTISRLQQRLGVVLDATSGGDPDRERARLQEDIAMSKQCLEVCNLASSLSSQKIHVVGEVVADEDCDQVVVTTLADLWNVKKVMAGRNSAQLVGSMDDASLQKLSGDRYNSRFGAVPTSVVLPGAGAATRPDRPETLSPSGSTTEDTTAADEMRRRILEATLGRYGQVTNA
ncbi:uncharacterized protein B0I36DRAFT_299420 [Microdochium trichocladiopsis]|uniref:Azaphilone pigments biosynthesis cluster protein L N-terminal domain-containing protein n=1 Tax=Microdochium trichocladiopsis TaxID=1682393 RepID=A0A9P9BLW5_9PEZI|nr:uncharacterized protein B0I36DRAFT_299420 [Microdochium trichocladiopsis]KAH7014492.1 hypothetical protein B0I36DRAFT_299420 [Microdochium trichocladiopsis]